MKLLDLPRELFEAILHYAILARGTKRGLRLRLINRIDHYHVSSYKANDH